VWLQGVASSFLNTCKPGQAVAFSLAPAPAFRMPMDPACPLVLVAAGTGIAPFRGFWAERSARAAHVGGYRGLAPAVLFFGCRSKDVGCFYRKVRNCSLQMSCSSL
jgi:cytochrome P450 / NADPH-cytochrome P450 reductase